MAHVATLIDWQIKQVHAEYWDQWHSDIHVQHAFGLSLMQQRPHGLMYQTSHNL